MPGMRKANPEREREVRDLRFQPAGAGMTTIDEFALWIALVIASGPVLALLVEVVDTEVKRRRHERKND